MKAMIIPAWIGNLDEVNSLCKRLMGTNANGVKISVRVDEAID
jgi:hypothetical protein